MSEPVTVSGSSKAGGGRATAPPLPYCSYATVFYQWILSWEDTKNIRKTKLTLSATSDLVLPTKCRETDFTGEYCMVDTMWGTSSTIAPVVVLLPENIWKMPVMVILVRQIIWSGHNSSWQMFGSGAMLLLQNSCNISAMMQASTNKKRWKPAVNHMFSCWDKVLGPKDRWRKTPLPEISVKSEEIWWQNRLKS